MPEQDRSPLERVRRIWEEHGFDAVWELCMAGNGAKGKAKWFHVAAVWARKKENAAKEQGEVGAAREWNRRQQDYAEESRKWARKYERRIEERAWPKEFRWVERLYHNPPHFHLAAFVGYRPQLIAIGRLIHERFDCRIAEHPYWEDVEPVHTTGSHHYRTNEGVVLPTSSPRLKKGGDAGMALDINDLDGGNDEEYAAYLEVGARYG